jgi:type VI secretion system secreted protein VgrG
MTRFSSAILPGDTLICGDDASFYPPIGVDDPAALAASTTVVLGGAAVGSVGVGVSVSGDAGATVTAGSVIGTLASRPAPPLEFLLQEGTMTSHGDKITRFEFGTSTRATAAEFRDYDPARPLTKLSSRALSVAPFPESGLKTLASVAASVTGELSVSAPGVVGGLSASASINAGVAGAAFETALGDHPPPYLEVYDHHGPFLFPQWTLPSDEAPRMLRQSRRRAAIGRGAGGCADLEPGHKFSLVGHPVARFDQPYVVTSVEHLGRSQPSGDRYQVYENTFECAPASMPFVPPKPKRRSVQVSLTAVVVGPFGSEIHVDALGQIKVQFHWDRDGKNDDNSSCWIRTMHPWAGAGWGVQFIPRVGMEVVVVFEGGDPDKPMVIGSLYNATHPSAFLLPQEKTRSGWRTQSSPGGGGFNELSFDDAKHKEQIYLHAQRDYDEVVEQNHTLRVKNDELIQIIGNRLDTIDKNLEQHIKGDHNSKVDGNRLDAVSGNSDQRVTGMLTTRVEGRERRDIQGLSELVYADDVTVRVLGCSTTIVGKNDKKRSWTTHAEGTAILTGIDRLELSSDAEVVLKVGDSSIRMTKDRIELAASAIVTTGEGGKLKVDKDGLSLKSSDTQLTLSDRLVAKSPQASLMMGKDMQLDGPKILLNSPALAEDAPPKAPPPPTKIELKDQDGSPVPFQRFVAKLDDGSEVGGRTDKDGKAELEIPTGGMLVFPEMPLEGEAAQGDLQPHVIRQGDHLARLAFIHGFDADKVWNDPKNAEIKAKRKKPSILHPGDIVYLPHAERQGMSLTKGSSNSYSTVIPRKTLRLALKEERLRNAKFKVEGLGAPLEGATDAEGNFTIQVPVHVREVKVVFPELYVEYELRIGDLDPIEERTGVRKRLEHLGFRKQPGGQGESEAEALEADRAAIEEFQQEQGIEVTGELDQRTRDALQKAHGS